MHVDVETQMNGNHPVYLSAAEGTNATEAMYLLTVWHSCQYNTCCTSCLAGNSHGSQFNLSSGQV